MEYHLSEDGDGLPVHFEKPVNSSLTATDFSLDPYAGYTYGGLPIWTEQQAADNLARPVPDWTFGNSGALDDGVLTFGFWSSVEEMQNSYYLETDADGYVIHSDSVQIYYGNADVFTPEEQAAARAAIELWDDLIAISIEEAPVSEADITFGYVNMSPAAGAHAFYPQQDALNNAYGYEEAGRIAGDVWLNWNYSGAVEGQPDIFADLGFGSYANFTLVHELGHSFGLAHGGEYNASYDGDGDGEPDPISYETHAYFAQDTQQYTIMSYFDGAYTGQNALRWNNSTGGTWMMAQTPQVHDILAIQQMYGADYTTRSGDTTYGFNSTADRDVFDFTKNDTPILTIWDGGGIDTLDLSGYNSDAIIDINEGAFSSAGYKINEELKAKLVAQGWTDADFDALYASWGLGPDGRPVDNIAIAYGAEIENAIGGSGHDQMYGNALDNLLVGNNGDDFIYGADGDDDLDGGNGVDHLFGENGDDVLVGDRGDDVLSGGAGDDTLDGGKGKDLYVFTDAGTDTITQFEKGETIDLSELGVTQADVTIVNGLITVELGDNDLFIEIDSGKVTMSDLYFG